MECRSERKDKVCVRVCFKLCPMSWFPRASDVNTACAICVWVKASPSFQLKPVFYVFSGSASAWVSLYVSLPPALSLQIMASSRSRCWRTWWKPLTLSQSLSSKCLHVQGFLISCVCVFFFFLPMCVCVYGTCRASKVLPPKSQPGQVSSPVLMFHYPGYYNIRPESTHYKSWGRKKEIKSETEAEREIINSRKKDWEREETL